MTAKVLFERNSGPLHGEVSRRSLLTSTAAAVAMAPAAAGRVYNLVGDQDVSIRDIATTVSELVGDTTIEHTPARAMTFAIRSP